MTSDNRPALYGLRARILRPLTLLQPDSSRVISGDLSVDKVFIVGDGIPQAQPVRDGFPLVLLKKMRIGDLAVRPVQERLGHTAYAASGAYVEQSGCGREWFELFGHVLPIPLHDLTKRRSGF